MLDRDGNVVAGGGPAAGRLTPGDPRVAAALAVPGQTFDVKGSDGVTRVWGFAPIEGKPLVVAFGIPGAAVYGPAQDAFERDILLALGAAAAALAAAFLLAGYLTAPIRRLAARVGPGDDEHDIGAIERGFEETQIELARRAERLQLALDQRNQANEELRLLNAGLEHRVAERTAQLQEANHELEAFSYSVSHDLRAPLRAIDGFSRILVDEHAEGLTVDAQRYIGLVRKNTLADGRADRRAARVRAPRPSGGRQAHGRRRGAGPGARRRRSSPTATAACSRSTSAGSRRCRPTRRCCVRSTRTCSRTRSSTAARATRRRIELGSYADGDRTVYFVRDNGVGFDMRYSDKLFEVFQRLHSDGYEGAGLGLALTCPHRRPPRRRDLGRVDAR